MAERTRAANKLRSSNKTDKKLQSIRIHTPTNITAKKSKHELTEAVDMD